MKLSNAPIVNSIGVNNDTKANESKPKGSTRNDRTSSAKSAHGTEVEDHRRNNKIVKNSLNRVDSSISHRHVVIDWNSDINCMTCNNCLITGNHDECLKWFLKATYSSPVKTEKKHVQRKRVWKATGRTFTSIGYQWRPTGKLFTLGEQCQVNETSRVKKASSINVPLGSQASKDRSSIAIDNDVNYSSIVCANDVSCDYVHANKMDPNDIWGSTFFSHPYLSGFKCRSYRSSCGIWTQAAQKI